MDENAGVILPKGVTLEQTEKKVTYLPKPEVQNGKNVIGKISYIYHGEEVGGANIYYDETNAATLKDSINMSEWFEEAVETANKEKFPVLSAVFVRLRGNDDGFLHNRVPRRKQLCLRAARRYDDKRCAEARLDYPRGVFRDFPVLHKLLPLKTPQKRVRALQYPRNEQNKRFACPRIREPFYPDNHACCRHFARRVFLKICRNSACQYARRGKHAGVLR